MQIAAGGIDPPPLSHRHTFMTFASQTLPILLGGSMQLVQGKQVYSIEQGLSSPLPPSLTTDTTTSSRHHHHYSSTSPAVYQPRLIPLLSCVFATLAITPSHRPFICCPSLVVYPLPTHNLICQPIFGRLSLMSFPSDTFLFGIFLLNIIPLWHHTTHV
jgi:hypothetical protein